jgi:hypothetical protein
MGTLEDSLPKWKARYPVQAAKVVSVSRDTDGSQCSVVTEYGVLRMPWQHAVDRAVDNTMYLVMNRHGDYWFEDATEFEDEHELDA